MFARLCDAKGLTGLKRHRKQGRGLQTLHPNLYGIPLPYREVGTEGTAKQVGRGTKDVHSATIVSLQCHHRCWESTQLSSRSRPLWWIPSCQVALWLAAGPATWLCWYNPP